MDPVTAFTALSVVSGVGQTVAAYQGAKTEAANLEAQARLADTQALQRDTANRDELTRFLSSMQAARGANGLGASSPNAGLLFRDSLNAGDRDRLVARGNDRQTAANYRAAAASKRKGAGLSLITGLAQTGTSFYSAFEYGK